MTRPEEDAAAEAGPWRAPASAWLRPVLMSAGGLLVSGLLAAVDQWVLAVPLALFALFMGYWTSPLRSGPHTSMAVATARRGDEVAIILWAPGNPLSARMQTAIRGRREDVIWVNVYRDAEAARMLASHGGRAALPLVIVGTEVTETATVAQLLDMQEAGRDRATGTD